jgi:hypothetical protein
MSVDVSVDASEILTAIMSLSNTGMIDADEKSARRQQLDPYVFNILHTLYDEDFQTFWDSEYTIPKDSDKAIVIVERRAHPNLKFCIQNAVFFCRGYSLHIFCSNANYEFVKVICGKQFENIHIHRAFDTIGTPKQGYVDYNRLLKTKEFYESLTEEHIITLETDCYFLKKLPESIYMYDYVASVWPWLPLEPGGGGLSYRKRSKMLKICEHQPSVEDGFPQDIFINNGVKTLGLKYPSYNESLHYFTESHYSHTAIGTHQWWTYCKLEDPSQENEIINSIHFHIDIDVYQID